MFSCTKRIYICILRQLVTERRQLCESISAGMQYSFGYGMHALAVRTIYLILDVTGAHRGAGWPDLFQTGSKTRPSQVWQQPTWENGGNLMLKFVQFCLSQLNVCISRSQSWQAFLCRCSFFFVQVFIDTIRTFQYQDRITFTCKVCGFLGESRAQVKNKLDEYTAVFWIFYSIQRKAVFVNS